MHSSWIFASVFGSIDKAATTNEFSTIELRSATTKFSGEVTMIISIILHTHISSTIDQVIHFLLLFIAVHS